MECDVVIVGSGIGGLSAAIAARLAGLRPILIEKQWQIGGSSALSGGVLWLPNNPVMHREGYADSREAALTYLANFVSEDDPGASKARREAFVDGVGPLVALLESQGIPLLYCKGYPDYFDQLPGGHATGRSLETATFDARKLGAWEDRYQGQNFPMPARASESAELMTFGVTWKGKLKAAQVGLRMVRDKLTGSRTLSSGAALQARMLIAALKLGCDIRNSAPFIDFEMDGTRVSGVRTTIDGKDTTIRARRGVLIAAGGFARNNAMRQQYQQAPVSDAWTHANQGDTGEAIAAMANAGAALGWMDEAWWLPGLADPQAPGGSYQVMPELHKPHVILVGADGKRFVNEAENYMSLGRACYERNKVTKAIPVWAVMDARHRAKYNFAFAMPGKLPKDWLDRGIVQQAGSIEELAAKCGIDPAALASTVANWNAMCESNVDADFGKGRSAYNRYYGDPTMRNPCMGPVDKPPFWAAPLQIGDVGTCGGAVTDEHARVKRPDGSVIEGLYATGNSTSPLAGAHYVGAGHSIGCSAVFGMIAVRHMANRPLTPAD